MLHIHVYSANIATLSCRRSKRNATDVKGAATAAGRAVRRLGGAGRWAGPGGARFAIPGRIRMSLRARRKSAHEPFVVGFAVIVQEQRGTGLAGMDPAEICKEYAVICKTYAQI